MNVELQQAEEQEIKYNKLFKSIFSNIFLFRLIFKYVKMYNINQEKTFKSRQELLDYREREFIGKINYYCKEMLEKGDLTNNGVLKKVVFKFDNGYSSILSGNIIPYGVEVVELNKFARYIPTPTLSTFPSTVYKLKNVLVIDDSFGEFPDQDEFTIPSNIKSISFIKFPLMNSKFIKIPNTIKKLNINSRDRVVKLRKCDIPDSVTNLSFGYNICKTLTKDILPNSIIKLKISLYSIQNNDSKNEIGLPFDFIPTSIETLVLFDCGFNIDPEFNLSKCNSIKNLVIKFGYYNYKQQIKYTIEPESLSQNNIKDLKLLRLLKTPAIGTIPNSVENLELHFQGIPDIFEGSIPNNVKSLTINTTINKHGILPQSLTSLEIKNGFATQFKSIEPMFKLFPTSLKSLILPIDSKSMMVCDDLNLNFTIGFK